MRRPQNLQKYPTCFDKTAVFIQQHQNKWEIFKFFFAFSEKLNFNCLRQKSSLLCCKGKKTPLKVGLCLSQQKFHFSQALVKVGKILNRQNLSHTKVASRHVLTSVSYLPRNIIFLSIYFPIFPLLSAGEKGLSFSLRRPSFRSCRLTLEDKVREWPCVSKEEAGSFPTEKLKGTRTAVLPEMHFVRKLMFSTKTPNKVHP